MATLLLQTRNKYCISDLLDIIKFETILTYFIGHESECRDDLSDADAIQAEFDYSRLSFSCNFLLIIAYSLLFLIDVSKTNESTKK